ncbi:MAG: hypothetical protein NTV70_00445 [Acidobacteria bacterium]|nr:hypothetical protein [Acidobacteriota bacterium]
MRVELALWIGLPLFVAAGSALLTYVLMLQRIETAVAREQQRTAEAQARLDAQADTVAQRIRAAEEVARRQSLDDFFGDLHVEERRYPRESKSLFVTRKSMVVQERLWFRNIPLSGWVEQELVMEEGASGNGRNPFSIFQAPTTRVLE